LADFFFGSSFIEVAELSVFCSRAFFMRSLVVELNDAKILWALLSGFPFETDFFLLNFFSFLGSITLLSLIVLV
jgi:hypothetical protein